jgi:very-short-patch-repair endonuclease
MEGYQFNRQFPVDRYIVDFVCRRLNLIIEVDGNSHIAKGDYDSQRQNYLENLGYTVLRYGESEIINELQSVHYQISIVVKQIETQLGHTESHHLDITEIPPAPL